MNKVQQYLQNIDDGQRREYVRIRAIAQDVLPEFEETISYGIPTIKYKGKVVIHFGAFKNHMSIFPGSGTVYSRMGDKLKPFRVSGGTLQFSAKNPISNEIVKEIIQIRLADIDKG